MRSLGISAWLLLLVGASASCTTEPPPPLPVPSTEAPSPNASILPAPLVTARRFDAGTDASLAPFLSAPFPRLPLPSASTSASLPPPRPLREDAPVDPDPVLARDLVPAIALAARFVWPTSSPLASPDCDPQVMAQLAERTERRVLATLSPAGRLRLVVASSTFAVASGVEIRARADRFGHVVVWPDQRSYRVLQPGTLRAFLNEGRADVLALGQATISNPKAGSAFGHQTTTLVLGTDLGRLTLTQAYIAGSAAGGLMLCRFLIELASGEPQSPACAPELVPLRADYVWTDGGRVSFEVTSLQRLTELDVELIRTPPRAPHFKADLLPLAESRTLLGASDLRALHKRDAPPGKDAGPSTPGLHLTNHADVPSFALLDGIPVAYLAPHHTLTLASLRPGSYAIRWIDFLGSAPAAGGQVGVPGEARHGTAPAAGGPPSD